MVQDLKAFLMKGNVVELAVAVIIGVAFGAVVTALVDNIINPIIAGIVGEPDISDVLTFGISDATVSIGGFLQAVLDFVIIGTVLFFIVRAYENLQKKEDTAPEAPNEQTMLLTEIRDSLRARG